MLKLQKRLNKSFKIFKFPFQYEKNSKSFLVLSLLSTKRSQTCKKREKIQLKMTLVRCDILPQKKFHRDQFSQNLVKV